MDDFRESRPDRNLPPHVDPLLVPDREDWLSWLTDNVYEPCVNAAVIEPQNAIAHTINTLVAPLRDTGVFNEWSRYEMDEDPSGTEIVAQNMATGLGSVAPYAVAALFARGMLQRAGLFAAADGRIAGLLNDPRTASVLGAGMYDGLRIPREKESRLGNAASGSAAFVVFEKGELWSKKLPPAQQFLARAGIGILGASTQVCISRVVSEGTLPTLTELHAAGISGMTLNLVRPVIQQRLSPERVWKEQLDRSTTIAPSEKVESQGFQSVVRKWLRVTEPPPIVANETPPQIAKALQLRTPPQTSEQCILSESTPGEFRVDNRGSMGHEKYRVAIELPDGSKQETIIRPFTGAWWQNVSTTRFRQEQAAYYINQMLDFDNGFPTTALRLAEKDGRPIRVWIQDASAGTTFEQGMRQITAKKFGKFNDKNVVRLMGESPELRVQVEQAFVERMLYGDTDFHSSNMVVDPRMRVRNIDLDCAFHSNQVPGVTSSTAFGVNHTLLEYFSQRKLSEGIHQKLRDFSRTCNSAKLGEVGLYPSESIPLLRRAQWFDQEGIFPEFHPLLL